MKYPCPCCGYKTFDHLPNGSYNICQVCYWEDDPIQLEDPNYEGGSNRVSLKQAQRNFINIGACEPEMRKYVRRPSHDEQRDENWKPFEEEVKYQSLIINLENIQSLEELHQLFQVQLNFPTFYGNNWDAFWDTITGLIDLPNPLYISGINRLRDILPREAAIMEETVKCYNKLGISKIEFL
ncbi:hypothetical protein GCM10027036_34350 [Flavihumibacter cheonanensis]|uniref:CPCC family cysteine-rich protein n=1 Tax=Flavihumibacter cheonanensis TaxID=1442385 RepID=UPI001EF9A1BC|nr:CPCC family cysteine-rich protein [Flavihumibacter cheonanensis]MCG7754816.1 barstar family protein [Flavihumibacter cheonanensis]